MSEEETIESIQESLKPKPVTTSTVDVQLREKLRVANDELATMKVQLDELNSLVDELLLKPLRELMLSKTILYQKLNIVLDKLGELK